MSRCGASACPDAATGDLGDGRLVRLAAEGDIKKAAEALDLAASCPPDVSGWSVLSAHRVEAKVDGHNAEHA